MLLGVDLVCCTFQSWRGNLRRQRDVCWRSCSEMANRGNSREKKGEFYVDSNAKTTRVYSRAKTGSSSCRFWRESEATWRKSTRKLYGAIKSCWRRCGKPRRRPRRNECSSSLLVWRDCFGTLWTRGKKKKRKKPQRKTNLRKRLFFDLWFCWHSFVSGRLWFPLLSEDDCTGWRDRSLTGQKDECLMDCPLSGLQNHNQERTTGSWRIYLLLVIVFCCLSVEELHFRRDEFLVLCFGQFYKRVWLPLKLYALLLRATGLRETRNFKLASVIVC